jgi:hypothetical protein
VSRAVSSHCFFADLRTQYLHESRHRHAVNRQRGNKGRFTNHQASDQPAKATSGSSGAEEENDFVDLDFLCSITGPLSPSKEQGIPVAVGVRAASAVSQPKTAHEEALGSLLISCEPAAIATIWPALSPRRPPLSPLLGSRAFALG